MERIFYPDSLVVIGVSSKPDNMGKYIIGNLKEFGYRGRVYALGRERGEVYGVPIHTSLQELPEVPELAVFLVPAPLVPRLLEECGKVGIKRAVIESAGFSEFSAEGRRLEEQLTEIARRWGIRFVGPNCLSLINLENGLCLPFAPLSRSAARPGVVSVIAQSGGVSLTYANQLSVAGLGVNKLVSIGNKTDLKETDYLEFLIQDPGTKLIILYLESIDDGRLMELALRSEKPILLHKAGRSTASSEILKTHTAALANDDRVVSAACAQSGMIRVPTIRAAVNYAKALMLPPIKGNRLAVVSRSGGHAVIAADAAERAGFRLIRFSQGFLEEVRKLFRAKVVRPTNPLDLGDLFDFDAYAWIVEEVLRSEEVDALLLIHAYGAFEEPDSRRLIARAAELCRRYEKPLVLVLSVEREELTRLEEELDFPFFTEVDEALEALAAARDYYHARARPQTRALQVTPHAGAEAKVGVEAEAKLNLNSASGNLAASLELISRAGVPVAPWRKVRNVEEARAAAAELGYPVALKVDSPQPLHKSEIGGVVLNVQDETELEEEFLALIHRVRERSEAQISGVIVQKMSTSEGLELILGGRRERAFGPVVLLGLGGIYAELLQRTAVRVAPLTAEDAAAMISELGIEELLKGYRGRPPLDREALVDAVLRVSTLMEAHPELAELDINPLLLLLKGVLALDARLLLKD